MPFKIGILSSESADSIVHPPFSLQKIYRKVATTNRSEGHRPSLLTTKNHRIYNQFTESNLAWAFDTRVDPKFDFYLY